MVNELLLVFIVYNIYCIVVGDLQVLGVCLLYYLVPDVKSKANLAKIVTMMKVSVKV